MTHSFLKIMGKAEELLERGEHSQALDSVRKLLTRDELSPIERTRAHILECRILVGLGKVDQAYEIVGKLKFAIQGKTVDLLRLDLVTLQTELAWRSGRYEEGALKVEEGHRLLRIIEDEQTQQDPLDIKMKKGELLRQEGILQWCKGEYDKALESHQESLDIFQSLDSRRGVATSLNNLGLAYWSKGDSDKAVEYYERSLAILQELGIDRQIALVLNNLGNVFSLRGEIEKSLDYLYRALEIRGKLGNKEDIATTLTNLGSSYEMSGNLNQASEYYEKSLEVYEELDIPHRVALALNNLGSIHETRGHLKEALDCHESSLRIRQNLGNKQDIALSLLNIGQIYQREGQLEKALEHFKRSLSLYEETGNDTYTSMALYHTIVAEIEDNNLQAAETHLEKLHAINEPISNLVIDQRYRVAKALILKAGRNVREKLQAQEILSAVVEEDIRDHPLTVSAMIHLCDLLLFELKMTDEGGDLLQKAKTIAEELMHIAKSQSSFTLLAETYMLQSKFALVEQDLDQAIILLAQGHIIAQEKGLELLARKASHEREMLQSQLDKWKHIIETNPSDQEMISAARLDAYLERMIRKTVDILTKEERLVYGDEVSKRKYGLVYMDLLKTSQRAEKDKYRVGIAQIGLSESGDILNEHYEEKASGLLGLRKDGISALRTKVREYVSKAHQNDVSILLFPEMTIDLGHEELADDILNLAREYGMYIVPGSYHNLESRRNQCVVFGPDGLLWDQDKHIPAIIHIDEKRFTEGIDVSTRPKKTVVCNTEFGRIAIAICRDFLDMDLRVELKNFDPPVDLILNPAFTPVTADFDAAHFDARRSIYAYCCFANVAEYGNSCIYSPERSREEMKRPKGEEGLIIKEVDLFMLRAERKKWEELQKKQRSFIQSTRL